MSKKIMVVATAVGFLGCLREKGDQFAIPSEEAFAPSWMEKLEGQAAEQAANAPAPVLDFTIKHVPAGNWVVLDKDGNRASRLFKKDEGNAKDLAQAEAVRLNAGGAPVLDATQAPALPPADEDDGGNLPDA